MDRRGFLRLVSQAPLLFLIPPPARSRVDYAAVMDTYLSTPIGPRPPVVGFVTSVDDLNRVTVQILPPLTRTYFAETPLLIPFRGHMIGGVRGG